MLKQVADANQKQELSDELAAMMKKQEAYFKDYAFNREDGFFWQGGRLTDEGFVPNTVFAVDCQTWPIDMLGADKVDSWFGEGASNWIWQITKARAGYYEGDLLRGVGFTDGHDVNSAEWTMGAVKMAKGLARFYQDTHSDWAEELSADAITMREGVEFLKIIMPDGSTAYKYVNVSTVILSGGAAGRSQVRLLQVGFWPMLLILIYSD